MLLWHWEKHVLIVVRSGISVTFGPTTIPEEVNLAPDSVLKLIKSSDVGVKVAHLVTHQGVVAGVRIFHVWYFALVMMEDVAVRMSHNYCRQ